MNEDYKLNTQSLHSNDQKSKLKKIILFVIVLAIIIIVIFVLIRLSTKNNLTAEGSGKPIVGEDVDIESIENKTREVIDSINYLNRIFSEDSFDQSTNYTNKNGLSCMKYTGESSDIYINVARTIYENPFSNKGYFDVKKENEQEDIYVCKPNCDISDISINNVRITKDNKENEKTVSISEKSYIIKKIDETWKFSEPIVFCKE